MISEENSFFKRFTLKSPLIPNSGFRMDQGTIACWESRMMYCTSTSQHRWISPLAQLSLIVHNHLGPRNLGKRQQYNTDSAEDTSPCLLPKFNSSGSLSACLSEIKLGSGIVVRRRQWDRSLDLGTRRDVPGLYPGTTRQDVPGLFGKSPGTSRD